MSWNWWIIVLDEVGESAVLYLIANMNEIDVRWCCTCIACPEQWKRVPGYRVTTPRTAERRNQQRYGGGWRGRQLQRADDSSDHSHHRIRFVYRLAYCFLSTIMGPVISPLAAVGSALEQSVADRLRRRRGSVRQQYYSVRRVRHLGLLHRRYSRLDGRPLGVSSYASTSLVCMDVLGSFKKSILFL